jgi:hypothetical protein
MMASRRRGCTISHACDQLHDRVTLTLLIPNECCLGQERSFQGLTCKLTHDGDIISDPCQISSFPPISFLRHGAPAMPLYSGIDEGSTEHR